MVAYPDKFKESAKKIYATSPRIEEISALLEAGDIKELTKIFEVGAAESLDPAVVAYDLQHNDQESTLKEALNILHRQQLYQSFRDLTFNG